MSIAFFVGCVTFVLMLFIKVPLKKMSAYIADRIGKNDEEKQVLCKRLHISILFFTMLVSMIIYYFVLIFLGETHFKMCCSLKAGTIAVALYMIFEQWFGDNFQI